MKNLYLIGDSIRMGYDKSVKKTLDGRANVIFPEENCRFASYVLRYFHEYLGSIKGEDIDVIHWNAGLWDVLHIFDDETLSPPDFYADTLKRISQRLRLLFPKAKQVFALSTWVQEDLYRGEYKRYNSDIRRFNEIAEQTLAPLGVEFNDLYAVTENAPQSCWSDLTHLNTVDGIHRVGGQVVNCLCGQLGIDRGTLAEKEAELFEIPERILGN